MVAVDRKLRGRYLMAFILTLSIFFLGIYFGSSMSNFKINQIDIFERDLARNYLLYDIQNDLIGSDPCSFINSTFVSQDLFNVGRRLESLEQERGKKDEDVISLKKYYTLLQVREYIFYKRVNKECSSDFTLNIFFYSNDPEKCGKCQDQGVILNYVREKTEDLRTYSIDADLDMSVVNYLMQYYKVNTLPTVVINENVYNESLSYEQIKNIIIESKSALSYENISANNISGV